jgi:hypothetical protein
MMYIYIYMWCIYALTKLGIQPSRLRKHRDFSGVESPRAIKGHATGWIPPMRMATRSWRCADQMAGIRDGNYYTPVENQTLASWEIPELNGGFI